MKFRDYYNEYLGIVNEKDTVFSSKFRNEPINEKYYYPVIISDYYGELKCSVAKEYKQLAQDFQGTIGDVHRVFNNFKSIDEGYRLREMKRFAYIGTKMQVEKSIRLTMDIIDELLFKYDTSGRKEYISRKGRILDEGRQYVIIDNNSIASLGFISDIQCGGGNVVVSTKEEYRGKGYGKDVVRACVNWSLENNILSIYLVESTNKSSVAIAESLGFKCMCKEFIISK